MAQIGTDPHKPRRLPLWKEALIVVGVTGVLGVAIGLVPHFR